MNNKELIGELSRRLGYTNKDAARLLTSVTGIMGEEVTRRESNRYSGLWNI